MPTAACSTISAATGCSRSTAWCPTRRSGRSAGSRCAPGANASTIRAGRAALPASNCSRTLSRGADAMRVIALLPVRNEAWVLRHALSCLSAFCDVVLVGDQNSDDDSRAISRSFQKVQLLESHDALVCEQARWQLLDAARGYDGQNLIWCTDADELVSPAAVTGYLAANRDALVPGTVIDTQYVHPWGAIDRYRINSWAYGPHLKEIALVDDRRLDYSRSERLPLHQPRV